MKQGGFKHTYAQCPKERFEQSLTSLKLVLLPSEIPILERLKVLYKVTTEHDLHFRADVEKC